MVNQENINIKENLYAKSIIYKIVPKNIDLDYVYIGSSIRFYNRKSTHKSDCHNELSPRYKLFVYEFIRQNGGWNNFLIQVIEEYCCENKRELEKREQYWKEIYKSNVGNRAYAEKNQYYKDHKEELNIKKNQYYKDHKDIILSKLRSNYANDESKRLKKKEYYLKNREKVLERQTNYYNNIVKSKKVLTEC